MKWTKTNTLKTLFIGAICFLVFWLWSFQKEKQQGHPRDYAEIKASGFIRIATEYNSISFYVNEDTITGFNYELIEAFAHDKGLTVKIIPLMSFTERLEGLENGEYDIIAHGIPTTNELKDSLLLTSPIILNKQVLVQRKTTSGQDSLFIKTQLDLAGRMLHVVKGSPTILRIHNLSNEIGDTIYIKEIEKYGAEQLIALVAHGDIDYAVCDEGIAKAAIDSFPQLDISTDISFTQFYAWGVSKQSPALLDSLNAWLSNFRETKEYKAIYQRHYRID